MKPGNITGKVQLMVLRSVLSNKYIEMHSECVLRAPTLILSLVIIIQKQDRVMKAQTRWASRYFWVNSSHESTWKL